MKAKGADIKDFWDNYWPEMLENWYYEGEDASVDIVDEQDNFVLELDTIYNTDDFGYLVWQGDGEKPSIAFSQAFRRYKKISENVGRITIVLSVPKTDIDALKSIVYAHPGWRLS